MNIENKFLRAAAWVGLLWIGFIVIHHMISSMIFFPSKEIFYQPASFGLRAEDAQIKTADGVMLHGWYFQAGGESNLCLLLFHGNAGNITSRIPKAEEWLKRGVSVLLVDYRGYGKSGGKIRRGQNIYTDGEAAFEWLKREKNLPPDRIILYGESVGCVPAVHLAAREQVKALVLESPFTSLIDLAKIHYQWVPRFFLKDYEYDNEALIPTVKCPTFILHGKEDEIVPYSMGRRLFQKAPEPKQFFGIDFGHHNDLSDVGGYDFFEKPFRFIENPKS